VKIQNLKLQVVEVLKYKGKFSKKTVIYFKLFIKNAFKNEKCLSDFGLSFVKINNINHQSL